MKVEPDLGSNLIRHQAGRIWVVVFSTALSVIFSWYCSSHSHFAGGSAVALNAICLLVFLGYACVASKSGFSLLLVSASGFGVIELVADFLCIRCTRTLDYSVARSFMVWESPWWMPLSWALVAVQVGVIGEILIRRLGQVRGVVITGLASAVLIPFYEEMAWGAHWWRYQNCLMIGHTPYYIILAESMIGGGIALMGYHAMRASSIGRAMVIGNIAGSATIFGGMIGWGAVEFIGRGVRPFGL
jgi:hypothetical protein